MDIPSFIIMGGSGSWVLHSDDGNPLFHKELLGEGTLQHPTKPWPEPFVIDRDYLVRLSHNTNEAIAAGIRIPLPTHHSDGADPEANRGYLLNTWVDTRRDGKAAIYGLIEVTEPKTADLIGASLRDVSVYIAKFGSGSHDPEGERIVHVALTNYPVYSGQENFVRLSSMDSDNVEEVPQLVGAEAPEGNPEPMKISYEQALRLGILSEEDDEGDVVLSTEQVDDIVEKATRPDPEPTPAPEFGEEDVIKFLSVDTESEKYFSKYFAQGRANINTYVESLENEGRLTVEMAEAVRTLLSVTTGYALSESGVAEPVDIAAQVKTLLSHLPTRSVINVTESLPEDLGANRPATEAEEFDPEAVANKILGR